jgi:heme/copper-type cytochrome/quinol oxidase subunit 2
LDQFSLQIEEEIRVVLLFVVAVVAVVVVVVVVVVVAVVRGCFATKKNQSKTVYQFEELWVFYC